MLGSVHCLSRGSFLKRAAPWMVAVGVPVLSLLAMRSFAVVEEPTWPEQEQTLMQIQAALAGETYHEALALVDSCMRLPHTLYAADTLRVLRAHAEEQSLYAAARAIPARQVRENHDAYAELARRYPDVVLYAEKAEVYRQKVERKRRTGRRTQSRPALRAPTASYRPWTPRGPGTARPTGCCQRCRSGKPCGNSCIARSKTCTTASGCAC
ncbi:MAG: hypothetical protein Rubg2KO_10820 [Rubricoccaceae bacterium]